MKKLILLLVMLSSVANAALPTGQRATIDSIDYTLYTLEEFKQLLIMDNRLKSIKSELEFSYKMTEEDNKIILKKNEIIYSLESSNKVLIKERDRIHIKWKEENRLRHIAENKPMFGSWVAWSIAGVAITATAVLVGVLATRE